MCNAHSCMQLRGSHTNGLSRASHWHHNPEYEPAQIEKRQPVIEGDQGESGETARLATQGKPHHWHDLLQATSITILSIQYDPVQLSTVE